MALFELEAVPHLIAKGREQYQDALDELNREYTSFLRFVLTRYQALTMSIEAERDSGRLRLHYDVPCRSAEDTQQFAAYLRSMRKYLRLREAGADESAPLPAAPESFGTVLDRRVDMVFVGGVDVTSASDLRLLPPDAPRPLNLDPQVVAAGPWDVLLLPWTKWLGEKVRGGSQLEHAYLAPVVRKYRYTPGPRRWQHTLASLAQLGGRIRITVTRHTLQPADTSYAVRCLAYFLSTMKTRLDDDDITRSASMFRTILADEPLFYTTVEVSEPVDYLLDAIGRDTDPHLFEHRSASRLRQRGLRYDDPAEHYTRYFELDETIALCIPPFTFRDALAGVMHFVPKPFHAPHLPEPEPGAALFLGTLDTGRRVWLAFQALTRHLVLLGSTGSGKTNSIEHVAGQLYAAGVPMLIIDPVKEDFEGGVRDFGLPDDNIVDFDSVWLRFNPFLPADNATLYSHAVILAKTLSMLSPNNPVGYDILLQMIKHVYRRAYQDATQHELTPDEFLRLTGADLAAEPMLAPTFDYFLQHGLEAVVDPQRLAAGATSNWTRETYEHFERQFGGFRLTALGKVLSTEPGEPARIQSAFQQTMLVQFGRWRDDREVNAACALLVGLLYEQRQSEYSAHRGRRSSLPLKHVAIIDEAHRIFPADIGGPSDRIISPAREVSTLMGAMMAECRAFGQGMIVAEQSAGKLNSDALINSATKIVHSVLFGKDKETLAAALSLAPSEQDYLAYMPVGEALALLAGVYQPLYIRVPEVGIRDVA